MSRSGFSFADLGMRFALLFWSLLAPCAAQRVLTQLTPERAFLGQQIHYYVQARDTDQAEFEPPAVDGLAFELQSAGVTDRSTQFSVVNGRATQRESSNFTFDFLVKPTRTGRFVIPPAKVMVGGAAWQGDQQSLLIDDPSSDSRCVVEFRAEPEVLVLGQEGRLVADVFLEQLPSEVNVKDPLELYDRSGGFSLFDRGTPPPAIDLPWISSPPQGLGTADAMSWLRGHVARQGFRIGGFRDRFLESGQVTDVDRKTAGGQTARYRRYRFSFSIRGEVAGSYSFAPVTLEGSLVARDGSRLVWRDAFARSAPLTLIVLEPPLEGRPPTFSGAVGDFKFEMPPPTPTRVRVGDAVYVTIVVAGRGFLKGVSFDLQAQLGERFRVERVGVTDSLEPGAQKPPGFPDRPGQWRQWDFKVYPLRADLHEIPALSFAWFNPQKRDYVVANAQPVPLTVDPAGADSNEVLVAGSSKEGRKDVELVATSALSANVTDLNLLADQSPRPQLWFALLLGLPFAYALLAAFVTRARRLRSDPALLRRMRAPARLGSRLREARGQTGHAALVAAHDALRGYVADLTDGDEEALTSDELARWLRERGVDPELSHQVRQLGEAVEAANYGGGTTTNDSVSLLEGLERIARATRSIGAVLILALGVSLAPASAQDTAAFTRGLTAFEARDFASAASAWEAMLGEDYENGYVLYDIGNAWLRAGELGRAIAAYRRASLFLPQDANLEVNLRRALDARKTPLSPPEHRELIDYLLFWRRELPFRTEMELALLSGGLAFAVSVWRLLTLRRGLGTRSVACLLGFGALLFTISAWLDHARIVARSGAVVVVDEVPLRAGPGEGADPRYEQPLGEGAEMVVEDQRDGWLRVLAGGQYEGWLPESAVARW